MQHLYNIYLYRIMNNISKRNSLILGTIIFGALIFFSLIHSESGLYTYLKNLAIIPLWYCVVALFSKRNSPSISIIIAFTIGILITTVSSRNSITMDVLYSIFSICTGCTIAFVLRFLNDYEISFKMGSK